VVQAYILHSAYTIQRLKIHYLQESNIPTEDSNNSNKSGGALINKNSELRDILRSATKDLSWSELRLLNILHFNDSQYAGFLQVSVDTLLPAIIEKIAL